MTKKLSTEDEMFRKLVTSLDGRQQSVAEAMGISRIAVSHRLHSEKHSVWWQAFKVARGRKRHRAAASRRYARQKKREAQARLDAQDPAGAAERALARALLESL